MKTKYNRFLTLVLTAATLVVAMPALADQAIQEVELSNVHPTQMAVGIAAVKIVANATVKKAIVKAGFNEDQKFKDLNADDREKVVKAILADKKPVRSVIGPDGKSVYIMDGHHRATALYLLTQAPFNVLKEKDAKIYAEIGEDFTGREDEFRMYIAKNGYFTPKAWSSVGVVDKEQVNLVQAAVLMNKLPANIKAIAKADNPLRSTIGTLFYNYGIDGEPFAPYVEFLVGEKIACAVGSTPGKESDPVVLERAARAIFGDATVKGNLIKLERPSGSSCKDKKKNVRDCHLLAEEMVQAAAKKYEAEVAPKAAPPAPKFVGACKL